MRSIRALLARTYTYVLTVAIGLAACTQPVVASERTASVDPHAFAVDEASCIPSCGPERCGQPDGCGGTCTSCAVTVCDCTVRVCGDDGCGGICGTCAAGETCSTDGQRCDCDDATVTYTLRAEDIDWERTEEVVVQARQVFSASAITEWQTLTLSGHHPRIDLTIDGACEPNVEVRWMYLSRWRDALGRRLRCQGAQWHVQGETEIAIPAGTGGACAP